MGCKESTAPPIPPIIPGGGDSGFGYGRQLTRVEVSVEPGQGGAALVTLPPSTSRTTGADGEQRVLGSA